LIHKDKKICFIRIKAKDLLEKDGRAKIKTFTIDKSVNPDLKSYESGTIKFRIAIDT